jgi:hypothetical protein
MMFNSPHSSAPMSMRGNALVFEKRMSKYADDGYIKSKLSVALAVLSDIKHVLREDSGLDLDDKTKILVKGILAAETHTAAQRLLTADPSLAHLGPLLAPKALMMMSFICSCRNNSSMSIGRSSTSSRDAYKTWNQEGCVWVDMRLHELHDESGFSVSNNTITRHASFTTNARFVASQQVWLPCVLEVSLHAQTIARGPLAAVRLHQAAGSGTARAAVRRSR